MEFRVFNQELSTEVKLLVPLTMLLLLFSYWLRDLEDAFFLASLFSLIFVLVIDLLIIVPKKFPIAWTIVKWLTLAIIILLTLIG